MKAPVVKRGRPRGSGHLQRIVAGRLEALKAGAEECGVHHKLPVLGKHPTEGNIVCCLMCRDTPPFTHNYNVGNDVWAMVQAWNIKQKTLAINSTIR